MTKTERFLHDISLNLKAIAKELGEINESLSLISADLHDVSEEDDDVIHYILENYKKED